MEHLALLHSLREAHVVHAEVFKRRGMQVVIVVVDDSPHKKPMLAPDDVALLLADVHKKTSGPARIEVALKPRRPRVKRRRGLFPTPSDDEREKRERLKKLRKTLVKGKKKPFHRRFGKK